MKKIILLYGLLISTTIFPSYSIDSFMEPFIVGASCALLGGFPVGTAIAYSAKIDTFPDLEITHTIESKIALGILATAGAATLANDIRRNKQPRGIMQLCPLKSSSIIPVATGAAYGAFKFFGFNMSVPIAVTCFLTGYELIRGGEECKKWITGQNSD